MHSFLPFQSNHNQPIYADRRPVLDWSRTSLDYVCEDGGEALQFDAEAYAAFDLYCLKRPVETPLSNR